MGVYNLNAKVSIMAVYTLTIKHFRFPQLFILFSLFMITNLFSVLTPFTFTSALSFNFTSFSSQELNISYEKAYADEDQVIQLTGSALKEGLAGRATYFRPMHLWNKASGHLTDFSIHFTFVIDSQNQTKYADGLTFFSHLMVPNFLRMPIVKIWVSITTHRQTQRIVVLLKWNLIFGAISNGIRLGHM